MSSNCYQCGCDPDEVKELRKQLVRAGAIFKEIEQIGEKDDHDYSAVRAGNIAHAARIELRLTDEEGSSK